MRVSTASQDAAYQRHAIERAAGALGEPVQVWFSDVASGASMKNRPALARLLEQARAGAFHRLWIWRLDRITRSGCLDMFEAVHAFRSNGVEVRSISDGFDFSNPASDVLLAVVAYCAMIEREKIAENQAAARARMELLGRSWGRPPLPGHVKDAVRLLRAQRKSMREIARALQISKKSVWKVLHENDPQAAAGNVLDSGSQAVDSLVY